MSCFGDHKFFSFSPCSSPNLLCSSAQQGQRGSSRPQCTIHFLNLPPGPPSGGTLLNFLAAPYRRVGWVVLALLLLSTACAQVPRPPHRCTPPDPQSAQTRPVWQGEKGWLFERSDLIGSLYLCAPLHPYLDRLAEALKRQGITPLALVIPTRGSVHYAAMGDHPALSDYNPQAAARGYRAFLKELRQAGFLAPDLLSVAPGQPAFFFRRDHHWSPAGARRSAKLVSAALRGRLAAYPPRIFVTRRVGNAFQRGTLQQRAERCCGLRFPEERVPLYETVLKQNPAGDLKTALFDEVEVPVVLVGTSNSLRGEGKPEMNFSGFLRQALGREVSNTAFLGAGLFGSLEAYLLSGEFRSAPPDVLIWETLYMNWHNNRFLGQVRQLVPSVYGPCQDKLVNRHFSSLWLQSNKLADKLGRLALTGHRFYLHLEFEDVTLVNFTLGLGYRQGDETLELSRTTRAPNTGHYFIELASGLGALEHLTLETLRPFQGSLNLSICTVPGSNPQR